VKHRFQNLPFKCNLQRYSTVRGDLVRALLTLKDRPKKFDHVIIETTGLADPAPVAFTFFINTEIAVGGAVRVEFIQLTHSLKGACFQPLSL
jgi:hypothetical protein